MMAAVGLGERPDCQLQKTTVHPLGTTKDKMSAGDSDPPHWSDRASTIDLDDEKLQLMTSSYSEIMFESHLVPLKESESADIDNKDRSERTHCGNGETVVKKKDDACTVNNGSKKCEILENIPSTTTFSDEDSVVSTGTTVQKREKRKSTQSSDSTCSNEKKESENKRPDSLDLTNGAAAQLSLEEQEFCKFQRALETLHMEGTVTTEGDMVHFVAEDLESKIKLASPVAKKGETPPFPGGSRCSTPSLYRQALTPQLPVIDPSVLNDLEAEARRVASSVDTLIENLSGILYGVSALTVDCIETYRDAVCKTCDSVDSNIKFMYQLMAKCEELSKSMSSTYRISEQIKEIKRLVDLFEHLVTSSSGT